MPVSQKLKVVQEERETFRKNGMNHEGKAWAGHHKQDVLGFCVSVPWVVSLAIH